MSLPYFPLYPTDFEAKTSHLTMAEDGAYNRLLRICWMTPGCTIPTDEAWIMRRVRAHTDAEKDVVRSVLAEFFTVTNGRYSNARLMRVWLASNDAHAKRKNAGAKGGKAKALKTNTKCSSNALAMAKQPEPEPEPDPDTYKKEEAKASLSAVADAKAEIAEAVILFKEFAQRQGWPDIRVVSKARTAALRARLKEAGLDGWRQALEKAAASDHCNGQNARGWVCNFDFLTRQSSFAKLMEGNYDNRRQHREPSRGEQRLSAAMRAAERVSHERSLDRRADRDVVVPLLSARPSD